MEALAAVSLAGNILQFIQTSKQIVSETYKIWREDEEALKETKELSNIMCHLQNHLSELERSREAATDTLLADLIKQCSELTSEMVGTLRKLGFNKPQGKSNRLLRGFILSAKIRIKKEDISNLEERINRVRSLTCTRLNFLLQ